MFKTEAFVGIEVAKQRLDVAIASKDTVGPASPDAVGLAVLCAGLAAATPAQIVMEATGDLKTDVAVELNAPSQAVVAANPRGTGLARATDKLAQTDELDAQVLVRFAAVFQPPLCPLPGQEIRALPYLVDPA